jgi:hypothetical protein
LPSFRRFLKAARLSRRRAVRRPRVFISYSRADFEIVDRLHAALRARHVDPIIDRGDIANFEEWWIRIEQLIASADVFVLTPDSVQPKSAPGKSILPGASISASLLSSRVPSIPP